MCVCHYLSVTERVSFDLSSASGTVRASEGKGFLWTSERYGYCELLHHSPLSPGGGDVLCPQGRKLEF